MLPSVWEFGVFCHREGTERCLSPCKSPPSSCLCFTGSRQPPLSSLPKGLHTDVFSGVLVKLRLRTAPKVIPPGAVGLSSLIMPNPTAEGTSQASPASQEAARLLAEEPDNGSRTTGRLNPHLTLEAS